MSPPPCPHTPAASARTTFPATAILLAALLAAGATLHAADTMPVLVVPPSPITVHLAVPLPDGTQLEASDAWQLVEVGQPEAKVSPAQLVPAIAADGTAVELPGRLLAAIAPGRGAEAPRRFQLEPLEETPGDARPPFRFDEISDASLKLLDGDSPVLVYNHGVITNQQIPANDPNRNRGCYIHPVWGIGGEVLTDDFPADHVHHHGIFWTWPHVIVDRTHHDLWLGSTIQDRFVGWICRQTGPTAAVLAVENGWFVGQDKVMIERVWIRAYHVSDDTRSLDLEFTWIPVERPITLRGAEQKGYGGLSMRFAPRSERQAAITTPSGRTSGDLVMARLPWADLTAPLGGATAPSGAALMAHPEHPDFPPQWMARRYGAMCPGWPGVDNKTLDPGKPVRLSYRVWIHKSAVELADLERAYAAYTAAIEAQWE